MVIEQTFFCAISPVLRKNYVKKTHEILKENGCIIGLLFNKKFDNQGPSFGGFYKEYIELFSDLFIIEKLENSVRSVFIQENFGDNEFWIKMRKK